METLDISTQSVLALFETNKEQRSFFVRDIVSRIENGEANPLVVHLQIKAMEDIINQLTSTDKAKNKNIELAKKYRGLLLEAASKYGSKSFDFHNARFTTMETGSKWHYENTEDTLLGELYEQQEELNKKIKERETFLQNVPAEGLVVTDETTGETRKVFRPYKTSTTTVSVSLK